MPGNFNNSNVTAGNAANRLSGNAIHDQEDSYGSDPSVALISQN